MKIRVIAAAVAGLFVITAGSAFAEKINCSNKHRSAKLSFSQKLYADAVEQSKMATDVCPEKGEHHLMYAMGLAELGSQQFQEAYTAAETKEQQAELLKTAMENFALVGVQFDSALVVESTKKLRKDVRESREHYWVEHYNLGIEMLKQDKLPIAAQQFEIARLIDPSETKGYLQGANAMIGLDQKEDAANLVKQGLEVDPEDKQLNDLLEDLFMDAARSLNLSSEEAGRADDVATAKADADKALGLLAELKARTPDDPNVYFEEGSAHLQLGRTAKKAGEDSNAEFVASAEAFNKASSLVPAEGEDLEFHKAAKMNRLLVILESEDYEATLAAAKEYCLLDPYDPTVWQIMAQSLAQLDNTEGAFAALMVFKSLNDTEVDVAAQDVSLLTGDAKAAYDTLGKPDKVFTYQEPESGNQVNSWFWPAKKQVISFMLGKKQGEFTW